MMGHLEWCDLGKVLCGGVSPTVRNVANHKSTSSLTALDEYKKRKSKTFLMDTIKILKNPLKINGIVVNVYVW